MVIFIVNDFFMRIIITENQYTRLFEQEEVSCAPTGVTKWNPVDYSFYDILYNGKTLKYGDYDEDKTHPIWVIQKKLGINVDGYYGKDMLEAVDKKLPDVDVCENQSRQITIGPDTLKKLGNWTKIEDDEMQNYILASTLVGENQNGSDKELNAILSTIKNRADKCGYSMKDSVLKGKQYSTWNYYTKKLKTKEEKFVELLNRTSNQKVKGFDRMLKIVKNFGDNDVIKVNHYVNPDIVDLGTGSTRTIAKSYNNNKKSAKKIGDHIFWWDKYHSC